MGLKVPIVGTNVVAEGAGPSPAVNSATLPAVQPTEAPAQQPQRQSLHNVRMRPQQPQVEVKGEFDKHGRLKWFPAETTQEQADDVAEVDSSTVDAGVGALDGAIDVPPLTTQTHATAGESIQVNELQRQIANLTQTVNILAQVQLKGAVPEPAKPAAPQPPDPSQVDWLEPSQVAEYHRLNNAYIQATVQHQVNEAMAPHGQTLQDARLNAEYNAVVYQHGRDESFQPTMQEALRLVAAFPNISIPDAYRHAASNQSTTSPHQAATTTQPVAKPTPRTMTREEAERKAAQAKSLPASQGVSGTPEPGLPASLRNVGALGRIMYHNQQSGRAGRPIGN